MIEGVGLDPREGILSHDEGIDLMPANIELAGMEMPIFDGDVPRAACERLDRRPIKADYDFVIFDCAPTLGIIPDERICRVRQRARPCVGRVPARHPP